MAKFRLDKEVKILGESWRIAIKEEADDQILKSSDGYTDKTTRYIAVSDMPDDSSLGDPIVYIKKVIRHEVIHAFMFESGLAENWEHKDVGQEELTVDWMAIQFPKMQKVLEQIYAAIETAKEGIEKNEAGAL